MLSSLDIIFSFIISSLTISLLKIYERLKPEYEKLSTNQLINIWLVVLISSLAAFYIKTIFNPLEFFSGGNGISNGIIGNNSTTSTLVGNIIKPVITSGIYSIL